MQKFEHKLRTTVHTRSVEQIMTRTEPFFHRRHEVKTSNLKLDNITTYLRKFQIERQNLNLAKRILQCQSEHNRDNYVKEWKKTKKFLKVRSNFKPQLSAQSPKIYKFAELSGQGRLLVSINFNSVASHMKQLSSHCLYLLKFNLGGSQLIPNKDYITLEAMNSYACQFLAPAFLKGKRVTVKLIKVIQNSMFEAGRLVVQFSEDGLQNSEIYNKMGKVVGEASFNLHTELLQKQKKSMTIASNDNSLLKVKEGGIQSVR